MPTPSWNRSATPCGTRWMACVARSMRTFRTEAGLKLHAFVLKACVKPVKLGVQRGLSEILAARCTNSRERSNGPPAQNMCRPCSAHLAPAGPNGRLPVLLVGTTFYLADHARIPGP